MIFKNKANERLYNRMRKYKIPYPSVVKKLEGKRNFNNYPYTKDMVYNDFQKPADVDENIEKAINSLIAKAKKGSEVVG